MNVPSKLNSQAFQTLGYESNTSQPIHTVYSSLACISRLLQKKSFY